MNPSLTKLISNDAVHNQPSPQGLSNTVRKQTKGGKVFDLIGGVGSFATILEKTGTIYSNEKKGDGKEGSLHSKGRLVGANNKVEKELPGNTSLKAEKNFFIKRGEKIAGNEVDTEENELPLGGAIKQSAEASSSKAVLVERTERKVFLGKLEASQLVESERALNNNKASDFTNALHGQHGGFAQHESTLEQDSTVSLMKDIPVPSGMKKTVSRGSIPQEDEIHPDAKPTNASGAKENIPTKKYMPEDMRLVRTGDENKNQRPAGDLDASKGFEIKGMTVREVSPVTKEHEILLKSNSLKPEGAIPADKINQVNEVMQEYENLFTNGRTSEKPVEKSLNDTLVTKIDTSLGTAQADISGIKGIGNFGSWSNMRADIATSVQFQDIMDQIEESAAQMLKKGPGRIVITLEPPNLGTLNLDVKVHNDMVRLVLIADNHEVKQVLQSNLDQLKTALQNQGLNMDRFDVLVQQRSSENPGFHQWGGALFEEGQGRRENTKEDGSPPQPLPVHGEDVDEPRLGIISLFA